MEKIKLFTAIFTVFMLSLSVMAADDPSQAVPAGEMDDVFTDNFPSNSFTYIEMIGNAPGMDEYRWSYDDFCWMHSFNETGVNIMEVNLTIRAYDVDFAAGEHDMVSVDGVDVGYLEGSSGVWSETLFSVDPALLADGEAKVCIDIDVDNGNWATTIDWSEIAVEYDEPIAAPEFGSLAAAVVILLSSPAFAYLVIKKRA